MKRYDIVSKDRPMAAIKIEAFFGEGFADPSRIADNEFKEPLRQITRAAGGWSMTEITGGWTGAETNMEKGVMFTVVVDGLNLMSRSQEVAKALGEIGKAAGEEAVYLVATQSDGACVGL